MAVEIIYETHSISADSEAGIATGWLPGELSPEGRALAAELGERRRGDGLDAVFTSDLWRAVRRRRSRSPTKMSPYFVMYGYASAITASSTANRWFC